MSDLTEVQPIDAYVQSLLKNIKETQQLDIDLENPTRGQRLEAALAIKEDASGFYSMEIMVGRRVSSDDPKDQPLIFVLMTNGLFPRNPRDFYNGFAHQYWPNKE